MGPRSMVGVVTLATCIASTVAATSAAAAQFCVGATGTTCDGGDYTFDAAGITAAVAATEFRAGADELRLAPGTITDAPAISSTSGQGLTVSGSPLDSGPTILRAAAATSTLITVAGSGNVSDLTLVGAAGTAIDFGAPAGAHTVARVQLSGFAVGVSTSASTGNAVVRDSVIDLGARENAIGLRAGTFGATTAGITARRVTVGGTGATQTAAVATALFGGTSGVSLQDSVFAVTGSASHAIVCSALFGGAASATHASSAFAPSTSGCAGLPAPAINLAVTSPWFVDQASGDYRPLSYSPFVDAAVTAPAGGTDARGGARLVDGDGNGVAAADLGGLEYQRQRPNPPTIDMPTTTVAPGQAVVFKATATDPDGEYPFIDWDFGDGSAAGGSVHAYSALGTYTATAIATDPVGLTSTAQVTITVANPPAPSDPGVAPTPPPLDPFATATGPRVRVLTPPTQRVKRSSAGFATVGGAAPDVATVEVAGAPTLRVNLTRLVPGRRSKGKCRSGAKAGKRCTVRVPVSSIAQIPVSPGVVFLRFGGKLGGKRLAKGAYEVSVVPVGLDKRRGTAATYPLTLR